MKTAMQELLKWAKNSDMSDTMISPQDLLNVINPLLEKEKEQILDARLDGFVISGEGWNGEYPFEGKTYEEISLKINNEEYYKITYDQSE
jgi:hypothetical protein